MSVVVIDIETEPLPAEEAAVFMPEFEPPGNYKDPEKIKAHLDQQKARWLADGALSALTGRVLCIGLLYRDEFSFLDNAEELKLVTNFWDFYNATPAGICGHCIKSFDLPFLHRRAWRYGLATPRPCTVHGKWDHRVIDTAEIWAHNSRDPRDRISLDHLSKFLGIGVKTGSGADFHALYRQDRPKAMEYVLNDLQLTHKAFQVMTK